MFQQTASIGGTIEFITWIALDLARVMSSGLVALPLFGWHQVCIRSCAAQQTLSFVTPLISRWEQSRAR